MKIRANGLDTEYLGTDLGMARTMHERIAGFELVVVPKAAHCSCVEAPDDGNRALLTFLQRVA